MLIHRTWAMPNSETFSILPIAELVWKYLDKSKISIDPFARNCDWATYTNDLNESTSAMTHMDCLDFLVHVKESHIAPDLVIFDPPYSPRQIKECYDGIGLKMGGKEALRSAFWSKEKAIINEILPVGAIVICFGWNTAGMGKSQAYKSLELLIVCHGSGHNDTLCLVQQKLNHQEKLDLPEYVKMAQKRSATTAGLQI